MGAYSHLLGLREKPFQEKSKLQTDFREIPFQLCIVILLRIISLGYNWLCVS